MTSPRRLSILGAGKIGRAVGYHWIRAGHSVTFGSRAPQQLASALQELGPLAHAASLAEAATAGDPILLAVPYSAVDALLDDIGTQLRGKIVIDATNPVASASDGRIISSLAAGVTAGSLMGERLPHSIVVRAFSHVMYELLESRGAAQPLRWAMAIAGDDPNAKRIIDELVRDTGFTPVDIGGLADSAPLDPGGPLFPNIFTEADMRTKLGIARSQTR